MPIAGYTARKETIYVDGEHDFTVRGIELKDLVFLMEVHRDDLERLYTILSSRQQLPSDEFFDISVTVDIIVDFIKTSPAVVATLIALCSDEDIADAMRAINYLPLPIQSEALQQIALLTFGDMVRLKNFVAGTWKMIQSLVPAGITDRVTNYMKTNGTGSTEPGPILEPAPVS